ncbi:hypothetical protein BDK92_3753 [Micromonospora pisi]|uniref:Dolichyl-phosphate-mannose-protein mannosyltransferase n=1 Tax=Micromonospora pisi TaxID=589240 RepID=A0A495JLH6_9ACTN|nr:hypothetical protein [Micromonospora pisi]RKR89408.1 hypothetical protein BDK92_3753 [Micromonospora pisi]
MPAPASALLVIPTLGYLFLLYAVRPGDASTINPHRLAAVRATLATGAYAVLSVELLGAFGALKLPAIALAWLIFLLLALGLAAGRRRRDRQPTRGWAAAVDRVRTGWRTATRGERLLAGSVSGLVLVELLVAILAEPNNFDSQTYHLPKVEHWVAQGSLEFWPTAIHRQVTIPPGAEYLLLHLRLFTGGDGLYNLVQWAAGVACLLLAARITAQLGGGRRAQLITAFLVGTTPMVVLQATSTQTDLVTAAWVACLATLVLDGLHRRATAGSALALGTATGLIAVTKTSGLLGAGPLLLLWGLAQLRLGWTNSHASPAGVTSGRIRVVGRTGLASVVILLVAAVITGPFLARVTAEFGNPLGPPRLRESIPMQRHDPGSILINALRIGQTALDTPLSALHDTPVGVVGTAPAEAVVGTAGLIGVDPQDRATTFGQTRFPVQSWYPDEDRVAFPVAGALALLGTLFALLRPGRLAPARPGPVRAYAVTVAVTLLTHTAMIKWQPWGNRLLLYALVLAVPLAGIWLDALLRRRTGRGAGTGRRSLAVTVTVALLAGSALAGLLAVSYGFPRRLVGAGSVFTTSDWDTRFLRRPQWAPEFRWAAERVRATDARRIGLVQQNDNWEYPWWLLLRDGSFGARTGSDGGREIVALQSVLPKHPPADPTTVDVIVCTGDQATCTRLVPRGWRIEFHGYVGVALPPGT